MGCRIGVAEVVFADDATESSAFQLQGGTAILGLVTDANWTTANIGLEVSTDEAERVGQTPTYFPLMASDGTTVAFVTGAVADTAYQLAEEVKGWFWIKLTSFDGEGVVAQAGGPTTVKIAFMKDL